MPRQDDSSLRSEMLIELVRVKTETDALSLRLEAATALLVAAVNAIPGRPKLSDLEGAARLVIERSRGRPLGPQDQWGDQVGAQLGRMLEAILSGRGPRPL